ncbi:MAG: ASPIC/UnbV domain-containing protein [Anaerolineales bacterium]|nr:ASPIC/UnbV domain-containing protein [Anaerolineales bacterium]
MSGDPARVHFGIPAGATIGDLLLIWPDGAATRLTDVSSGQLLLVERDSQPVAAGVSP